jgi:hypothetical protein
VAAKNLTCLFGFAYEKSEAALLLASCTKDARKICGAVGIETITLMETKEFCGVTWPSKELKRK